jgi:hypothetical protein
MLFLYNENKYELSELIDREEKAVFIQNWWKNKLDEIYMEGFNEEEYPQDLTEWICGICSENILNCECFR